jgi:hypothetical protein
MASDDDMPDWVVGVVLLGIFCVLAVIALAW